MSDLDRLLGMTGFFFERVITGRVMAGWEDR